jgi:hypothetical protein
VYEAENIIEAAEYRAKRNSRRKALLGAMSRYARKPLDLVARRKLGTQVLQWKKKIKDIQSRREFLDAMDAGSGRGLTARTPEPNVRGACLSRAPRLQATFLVFVCDASLVVVLVLGVGESRSYTN